MARFDEDGDGLLGEAERPAAAAALLARMDDNQDGVLSLEEFKAMKAKRLARGAPDELVGAVDSNESP